MATNEVPPGPILDRGTVYRCLEMIHISVASGDNKLALAQIEHLGHGLLIDSAIEEKEGLIGIYAEHNAVPYEAHQ